MKNSTIFTTLLVTLILMSEPASGQFLCTGGGLPATATLSLTGRHSLNGFNNNNNARGTFTMAFSGQVVGLELTNVNLTTFSTSWCSEAVIEIADIRNSASNWADINPSLDDNGSPCSDLPLTEFFDLGALGLEFPTNGTSVYWELYETTNDVTGAMGIDATYTSGTVTVYVCPLGQILPLELKFFNGRTEDVANTLEWETLTEKNVAWHIVERSVDGEKWMEIGRKAGQSDSQNALKYDLEDRQPLAKAYYRLRSVDYDGAENVSNSITLTRKNQHFGITAAFPSPVRERITVQFSTAIEENVMIRLLDLTGRVVLEQEFAAENGINEAAVQLSDLQAGIYLLTVSNSTSRAEPVRIVKE